MYGIFGGCTSLFHLAIQFPKISLALSLAGFVQFASVSTPGQLMGTAGVFEQLEKEFESSDPGLQVELDNLEVEFKKVYRPPTREQVRTVLNFTDACTDANVNDVLSDPVKRREAAWLLYLDTYSREGLIAANKLFVLNSRSTPELFE